MGHQSVEKHNEQQTNPSDKKSGFLTWTWVLGLALSISGELTQQGVVTPFADLVAMSFNASLAIVIQVCLAVFCLKEVFVVRYDLTAIILILIGSSCIILTANFSEVVIKMKHIRKLLTSPKSMVYYSFTVVMIIGAFVLLNRVLKKLAVFERDVE